MGVVSRIEKSIYEPIVLQTTENVISSEMHSWIVIYNPSQIIINYDGYDIEAIDTIKKKNFLKIEGNITALAVNPGYAIEIPGIP